MSECAVRPTLGVKDTERLYTAIQMKDIAVIRSLIDSTPGALRQHIPFFTGCGKGGDYVVHCITKDCVGGLKLALERGLDPNEPVHYMGRPHSLFALACEYAPLDTLRIIVDAGFDLNQKDGAGDTPLVTACHVTRGSLESAGAMRTIQILDYLIEKNAPWGTDNERLRSPVPTIARFKTTKPDVNAEVMRLIRKGVAHGWNPNGVIVVPFNGRVQTEVQCGISVALRDKNIEMLHLMIEIGVDTNPVVGKENLLKLIERDHPEFLRHAPEIQAAIMRKQLVTNHPTEAGTSTCRSRRPVL